MTAEEMTRAASLIESETDANAKALLLAALVSEEFRARGFEPVIVGGSAIEFYTDGAYMSGDVDVCFAGARTPTPVDLFEVMRQFTGAGLVGTRSWKVFGVFLDLHRKLQRCGDIPNCTLNTSLGHVVVLSVEEVLAERIFAARGGTGVNAHDEECVRQLTSAILRGDVKCDWQAMARIASGPEYRCADKLPELLRNTPRPMPDTTLPLPPDRCYTWEQWQAGRAERRRLGNLVAPPVIRRPESSSDKRLRAVFDGERGPPFGKAFDPDLK